MSSKLRKILAWVFIGLTSAILTMSGMFKLSGGEEVVNGLSKIGFGSYVKLLGIAELIFVALFLYPKTYRIGFFFVLSYLGGAAAIEIASGNAPVAFLFIAFAWIGVYLREPGMFLKTA